VSGRNVARRRRAAIVVAIGGAVTLCLSACNMPPGRPKPGEEIDASRAETRDDIVEIVQYWRPEPWLYDADRRPVGFRSTVYFVSGATDRGAFVPGNILIWLYVLEPSTEGVPQRKHVFGWEFDEPQSVLYRVRKASLQGYYYGFPLLWGPEVDVLGREIEVVFGYERKDGRILSAPGRRLHVPVPPGYRRPTSAPANPTPDLRVRLREPATASQPAGRPGPNP